MAPCADCGLATHYARGWCRRCYMRRYDSGEIAPRPQASPCEVLWRQIEHDAAGCWLWTGYRDPNGYGRTSIAEFGRSLLVHRLLYSILVEPVPAGLELDHRCRNRGCVNPSHLEPVTHAENMRRAGGAHHWQTAKTECPQGHPYDEANTLLSHGRRNCRQCRRERYNARKARK